MIDQLLDFRKNEAGLTKLDYQVVNMVEYCKEIGLSFKHFCESQQIQFEFQADADELITKIDPNQFEKVLFNLLSNAIKFSEPGGMVRLQVGYCNDDSNAIEIVVHDNGKGIPAEQLPYIFDRFYQVAPNATDTSTQARYGHWPCLKQADCQFT